MPSDYPRSPKLLKGAFVKLSEKFLGPIPNIIVFQYNPETMSRDLTPSSASVKEGERWGAKIINEPFDPAEKFDLTLELDATDALEDPDNNKVAAKSGIAGDVPPGSRVGGQPAIDLDIAKRNALAARDLYGLVKRVRRLEKELKQLRETAESPDSE